MAAISPLHAGCFWHVTPFAFSREGGCFSEVGISECSVFLGDCAEAFDDVDKIFFICILLGGEKKSHVSQTCPMLK